jgi:hypothetical protein
MKDAQVFWNRLQKTDENSCWLWTGAKFEKGYGSVYFDHQDWRAHRLAYFLVHGSIPEGKIICHSCDNPPCCNPNHLWLGTLKLNAEDSCKKGRNFQARKTHCKRGHEFTPDNILHNSEGRRCRACTIAFDRARRKNGNGGVTMQNSDLEDRVLKAIKSGRVTFTAIDTNARIELEDGGFRVTDRALQKLRRKGLIAFKKGIWSIAKAGEGAKP